MGSGLIRSRLRSTWRCCPTSRWAAYCCKRALTRPAYVSALWSDCQCSFIVKTKHEIGRPRKRCCCTSRWSGASCAKRCTLWAVQGRSNIWPRRICGPLKGFYQLRFNSHHLFSRPSGSSGYVGTRRCLFGAEKQHNASITVNSEPCTSAVSTAKTTNTVVDCDLWNKCSGTVAIWSCWSISRHPRLVTHKSRWQATSTELWRKGTV